MLRRCRGSHSRCFHAYVGHEWMDPTSAELRGPPDVRRPRLDGPCLGRAAAASKRASTRTARIQPRGGAEGASWRASTRSGLIRSRGSCGGWSERVGREWIDPATLELQQRICAEAWGDQHHRKPSVENSPLSPRMPAHSKFTSEREAMTHVTRSNVSKSAGQGMGGKSQTFP